MHLSTLWLPAEDMLKHTLQYSSTVYPKPALLYTPQYTSEYGIKFTPQYAPNDTATCTQWYTPSRLVCKLPSKLLRCSQVYFKARSQIHSQPSWQYAPMTTLKILLTTLPSMLSSIQSIALEGTLPSMLSWYSWARSQAYCQVHSQLQSMTHSQPTSL